MGDVWEIHGKMHSMCTACAQQTSIETPLSTADMTQYIEPIRGGISPESYA